MGVGDYSHASTKASGAAVPSSCFHLSITVSMTTDLPGTQPHHTQVDVVRSGMCSTPSGTLQGATLCRDRCQLVVNASGALPDRTSAPARFQRTEGNATRNKCSAQCACTYRPLTPGDTWEHFCFSRKGRTSPVRVQVH